MYQQLLMIIIIFIVVLNTSHIIILVSTFSWELPVISVRKYSNLTPTI